MLSEESCTRLKPWLSRATKLSVAVRLNSEVSENIVATMIDFGSTLLAYHLGVSQLGVGLGIAYAVIDALVVIWLRKPLTRAVRRFLGLVLRYAKPIVVTTREGIGRR